MSRPLPRVLALALLASPWSIARADDTHDCVVASREGQLLRDDRKLVEATARFAACARSVCPGPVRQACLRWNAEVSTEVPTVVLAARDAAGHDLLQVRVLVDGKLVAQTLDGGPIAEDPGPHLFRFEPLPNGAAVDENIVVREGERNRLVSVVLGATAPAPSSVPTAASSRAGTPTAPAPDAAVDTPHPLLPTASWAFGAVGVVGLAGFAAFGLTGEAQRASLQSTCAQSHTCDPNAVGSMRTELTVADVSLGIGVVALAAATYFALVRPSGRTSVAVGPSRQGGLVVLQGAF